MKIVFNGKSFFHTDFIFFFFLVRYTENNVPIFIFFFRLILLKTIIYFIFISMKTVILTIFLKSYLYYKIIYSIMYV